MKIDENKKIKRKTKLIFVTGGVISGLGKGIVAASLGRILKNKGYSVFIQKLDPYLNYDPGVLSPFEHGEVFVTADGGETDLDLGHYERFIDEKLTKESNYTSGSLFAKLNEKERKGKYLGATVQIFPHFSNEIIYSINKTVDKVNTDFFIVEIGGTVGDIESLPFHKAISEINFFNPGKCFFVHTSFVPYLNVSKEFKTKPTQFSVQTLNSLGVKANLLVLRSENQVDNNIIKKIENAIFLQSKSIISLPDLDSVYKVPNWLEEKDVSNQILDFFHLQPKSKTNNSWEHFLEKLNTNKKHKLKIAMIGKYVENDGAYNSIKAAINISSIYNRTSIKLEWLLADDINEKNISKKISGCDGIIILPGFGARGFEGKVIAANYTSKKNIPTLGICLGMQAMTVAQARKKGIKNATSFEFRNENKKEDYIFNLIEGKNETDVGGSLRLGEHEIKLKNNSIFSKIYDSNKISERHRHRYEFVKKYQKVIEDDSFIFSGFDALDNLVETCEKKDHIFYLGTQYHPEFNASPLHEHPLFSSFIKACISKK